MLRRMRVVAIVCMLFALVTAANALASGVTDAGDDLRTGWYPNEPSITPQLVSGGTFGQLWSTPVEGQVYAQPLLDNGTLLVATESNKVYGLNPATGAQQWAKPLSLGTPWNAGDISCADLAPTVGVTATPVIDSTTNIAYLTHKSYVSGSSGPARWYMDAVSMSTGKEQPGFPVLLSGSAQNAPSQSFEATTELQRPGLLLLEGVLYAAFGSDCDTPPWQGWVFGVSTSGSVKARWVADATGDGAGIWQSGAGLTSDGPGTILLSTGNGGAPSTPTPGNEPPSDLGESVVRLNVQSNGSLKAVDFFAPFDATTLDSWDADFASGGVTGLPEAYFGTSAIPHLAVAVGKDGYVYLLNRDNLGGIGQGPSGSDDVVQRIGPYGGVWSRPGVWPGEGGWVYIPTASGGTSAGGSSGNLRVYQYGLSGTGSPTLSLRGTSSEAFGFSSSAPVITSEGATPGSALVWVVWAPGGSGVGAQLRAYDPVPVNGEPVLRWSAPVGTSSKFALPGVGAGRIYVGTRDGHVLAFGSPVTPVLSGSPVTFPTTTIGESNEQTLTLTANEALTLSSLGSSSSQFTIGAPSIALPANLAAGQSIQVPVTFTPGATGPIGASVEATTTAGKTAMFALSGVGQASAAKLEVVPPLVTFGGTTVGEHLSAGATFRNVGGTPLEIQAIHLPSAPFGASGIPAVGSKIAPGASVTLTVTFEPSATGQFSDQIGLDTNGGDEAIGLSGSAGLPGALRFTNETSEYGTVRIGSSASRSFTITNTGGTTVTITKSKPPIGGEFAAITSLPEGTTIAPGESVTESVTFAPTSAGTASAAWIVNGDDSTGLHEIAFTGEGVAPERPAVETELASAVGQSTAQLNATVNPNGEEVGDCHFEYGSSILYGSSVPCAAVPGAGVGAVEVSATVEGLRPNTAYYTRVVSSNAAGTSYGAAQTFVTQPAPTTVRETPQLLGPLLNNSGVLPFHENQTSGPPVARVSSVALTATSSGVVRIKVSCPAAVSRCRGTVALRTLFAYGGSILSLGSAPFTVPGGQTAVVKLHLSKRAHALLERVRVLRAHATLKTGSAGAPYMARTIVSLREIGSAAPRRG